MKLRVKEICREKNTTLREVARRIGITNVNLSNSLNGNPTLSRLKEVADILGVEVWELFKQEGKVELNGFIQYKEEVYNIKDLQTLEEVFRMIKTDLTNPIIE